MDVTKIAGALLAVQKELEPIHKARSGYGYKYADLPSVMNSCVDALNKNGVVVIQSPTTTDKMAAAIETRLIHAESGQEVSGVIEVPYGEAGKMSIAQAYGSAMTYARRYALVSMLGIITEDDDGANAGSRTTPSKPAPKAQPTKPAQDPEAAAMAFLNGLDITVDGAPDAATTYQIIKENEARIRRCATYPALEQRAANYLAVLLETV